MVSAGAEGTPVADAPEIQPMIPVSDEEEIREMDGQRYQLVNQ